MRHLNYIRFIVFLGCISLCSVVYAQKRTEAVIDEIKFEELTDITARKSPVKDANGEYCALIRVYAPLFENLDFKGSGIYRVDRNADNTVSLWILDGCKDITVNAKDLKPQKIVFKSYGYPSLHGKTVYRLDLTLGHEAEEVRWREKIRYKTKTTDSFTYDEAKTYYFLTYQYSIGYPFGVNFGICKKYGVAAFISYTSSDIQFGWEKDEVITDSSYRKWISFGAGPMFRLSSKFYLQTLVGLSTDGEDSQWAFMGGASVVYKFKRLLVGLGYNYYGASSQDDRNVLTDGITAQIGICF